VAIRSSTVAKYVKLADKLTKGLQPIVAHRKWLSQQITGEATYGSKVNRRAIVELRVEKVRNFEGQEVDSRAYVAFIGNVAINPKDEIVLADGTTGPILRVVGLEDADSGGTLTTEVWLG